MLSRPFKSADGRTFYVRDHRTGTCYRCDAEGNRIKRLGKAATKAAKRRRQAERKR